MVAAHAWRAELVLPAVEAHVAAIPDVCLFHHFTSARRAAIAGGQLQTTGTLVNIGGPLAGDRALAVLDIVDDTSAYQIPLGAAGEAAIYIDHFHELSLLRKILLRMRSWQNYVFFESL